MPDRPLLGLGPDRIATETRRARDKEAAERALDLGRQRVFWQCVALSFAGVPFYAWSWHLTDPRQVNLAVAVGFFISYALPYFRWLAHHVRTSDEFRR